MKASLPKHEDSRRGEKIKQMPPKIEPQKIPIDVDTVLFDSSSFLEPKKRVDDVKND